MRESATMVSAAWARRDWRRGRAGSFHRAWKKKVYKKNKEHYRGVDKFSGFNVG